MSKVIIYRKQELAIQMAGSIDMVTFQLFI